MDKTSSFVKQSSDQPEAASILTEIASHPQVKQLLDEFLDLHQDMRKTIPGVLQAYEALIHCFASRSTLFLCGNGGSFSDALHISGELLKSFERKRDLSLEQKKAFQQWPEGPQLAAHLEQGFPVRVLGLNSALSSAVQNDNPMRDIPYAQELYACARPADVLMGISTSGNATNVCYAVITASALSLTTIGLTGADGGRLGSLVDIAIRAPGGTTKSVQEHHTSVYHLLCAMVEARFYERER